MVLGCTSVLGYSIAKFMMKKNGEKVRGGALPVSFDMFSLDAFEMLSHVVSSQLDIDNFASLVNSFQVFIVFRKNF